MKNTFYIFIILIFFISLSGCGKSEPTPLPAVKVSATITTNTVNSIAMDSAVAGGNITLNGDTVTIIESGVCFATSAHPDITKLKVIHAVVSGAFSCTLTNLTSKSVYYVRAYYKNAAGTVYGNEVSFTSAKQPIPVGDRHFTNSIYTICTDPAGNLYAGGAFTRIGNGTDYFYLTKWDGTSWNDLIDLQSGQAIRSVCADADGSIYMDAWRLVNTGFREEFYVAKRTGNTWSDVGIYNDANFYISNICTDKAGNVYAIGNYQNASGKYYVAKWSKSGVYSELGSFTEFPLSICTDPQGNLYAAGLMKNGSGNDNYYIAKWDGNAWTQLGNFNGVISSICIDAAGNLLAGGSFLSNGRFYVAKWDSNNWSELGILDVYPQDYLSNNIYNICTDPLGNVYASGNFKDANGRFYVAKWNGTSWSELASFNGAIKTICADSKGNVYAAGDFTDATGQRFVALCN